jgi:hypothetical protein
LLRLVDTTPRILPGPVVSRMVLRAYLDARRKQEGLRGIPAFMQCAIPEAGLGARFSASVQKSTQVTPVSGGG